MCVFSRSLWVAKIIKALSGPKYNGKYLHKLVKEKLGDTKLHQTLTNIVIPTFDIRLLQPTIFSSYEVSEKFDFVIFVIFYFLFFILMQLFFNTFCSSRTILLWMLLSRTYAFRPRLHPLIFPLTTLKLKTSLRVMLENLILSMVALLQITPYVYIYCLLNSIIVP